jgi:transcriptional regulator with XRE-family HTH domain
MARPYSKGYLMALTDLDSKRLGVRLAKLCVKANLPAQYVAEVFGVSRMTIHSWFRGKAIRDKNCTRIENFMVLVREGLHEGDLPVSTLLDAKKYLEYNVSNKI